MHGVAKGERVDLSSRVDLLRYQEDRTIEEAECPAARTSHEGSTINPPYTFVCDRSSLFYVRSSFLLTKDVTICIFLNWVAINSISFIDIPSPL